MTSTQAEREQAARIFIDSLDRDYTNPDGSWRDYQETVQFAAQYLAAQRAAGLEDVANEMARHPYWSKEAEIWIKHLRQLAQEQRP